jgi:cyclopropane fatty-acyl-phospholipid synthase-like methyltransferase
MSAALSARLQEIVDALPLESGMRVLEIGCGPGGAAREVAKRVGNGFVLGVDRSAKAIAAAVGSSQAEIASGRLAFRTAAAEELELLDGEAPFDLAFAVRVGAFDGRHPGAGRRAKARLKCVLKSGAPLFTDGGNPLRRIPLDD